MYLKRKIIPIINRKAFISFFLITKHGILQLITNNYKYGGKKYEGYNN